MKNLAVGALIGMGLLVLLFLFAVATEAGAQRRLEKLRADEAAYEAVVVKPRQDAIQADVRRCLEQELTPMYAVNPEQVIVDGARLTAEAFKIIVCVEAK
jgi:hypothetical protein